MAVTHRGRRGADRASEGRQPRWSEHVAVVIADNRSTNGTSLGALCADRDIHLRLIEAFSATRQAGRRMRAYPRRRK